MADRRSHLVFSAYISAARSERYEPADYTDEAYQRYFATGEREYCDIVWDVCPKTAAVIYQVFGYSHREQFAKGIVPQPGYVFNLLICSELRRIFGDISDVEGFDRNGNFVLQKWNDVLIPKRQDGRIVDLYATTRRALSKDHEATLTPALRQAAIAPLEHERDRKPGTNLFT